MKVSDQLLREHVPDAVSLGDHLKTFSIVYDGDPIDERAYMDAVLAEVDAEPAFAEPTSQKFIDELDSMVWHQDEPIVSTGPYAQWCVMRLAQPEVTVLLNGQGGDELLAGYVPYQYVYLREAYHPAVAFTYGWGLLLVTQTGGMAAVAVIFASYFRALTGADWNNSAIAAIASEPLFEPARLGDVQRSLLDPSRAGRELGWRARVGLGDGLRATWDSLRA